MWLAENCDEPPRVTFPGFSFANFRRSAYVLWGLFAATTIASGV
jgi:hypothetical protein